MRSFIAVFGRVLWQHWPVMMAWYVGGRVVHDAWIQFAGWVAGHNTIAGYAMMPIAMIANLVGFVGMFLVVRDALPTLTGVAPQPVDPVERRRSFRDALFAGMLPYFAFYATARFLNADMIAFLQVAEEVRRGRIDILREQGADNIRELVAGSGDIAFVNPFTLAAVLLAYGLRLLWKRYAERVPRWLTPVGVYVEAVWVIGFVVVIGLLIDEVMGWVDGRMAAVWAQDIGDWFAAHLSFVAVVWEGIGAFTGQVADVVLLPISWLTIAGVIYGQAIEAEAPQLRLKAILRARRLAERVKEPVRRRIADLFEPITSRVTPIWSALVMMLRAGPVFVGGFVLAYGLWRWGSEWLQIVVPRLFGGHDQLYWSMFGAAILFIAPVVCEPIRIALVSAGYDTALSALRERRSDGETRDAGDEGRVVFDDHVKEEGTDGIRR
ncbi:hypothetical protein [Microbacterium sp. ZW T5_56]|uniref:hypothetical protein n=1 Tax=Microbacterium sp. ZW T5_56 TaxID=3378081 RepID=UPI003851F904